jgi:hypothetical protein
MDRVQEFLHSELLTSLIVPLIAGVASILVGSLYSFLSRRLGTAKTEDDIEKIAQASRIDEEARRVALVESLVTKLPSNVPLQEISDVVDRLRKEVPVSFPDQTKSPAVESLISGYHGQALAQANAQFWFSVGAATVGFGWILYAGVDIKPDNFITVLKTLPGVIMNAVAFLFFKQASETRQRATDLYDRLRRDKQTTESVALVAAIRDDRVRSAVQAQIALHMAGLQPNPIDLTNFLIAHDETMTKMPVQNS